MSLTAEVRVGKKYALYLPKSIVQAVGVKEGDKVLLKTKGRNLTIEIIENPIELAVRTRKFASLSFKQVEAISREEQVRQIEGSS